MLAIINPNLVGEIIGAVWIIFVLYWVISVAGRKKLKQRAPPGTVLRYISPIIIFILVTSGRRGLNAQVLPINAFTQLAGLVLCITGMAFAFWARKTLGRNWSGVTTIREDHELIQAGPYAIVRHPIYTGLLTSIAGSTLAGRPTIRGLLFLLAMTIAFYLKSRQEEKMMTQEFGEKYIEYKNRVKGGILPFAI